MAKSSIAVTANRPLVVKRMVMSLQKNELTLVLTPFQRREL
jgi:hypothetical protein